MDINRLIWSISVILSAVVIILFLFCNFKSVTEKSRFTKLFAVFNLFGILAQIAVFLDYYYEIRPYLYAIFTTLLLLMFAIGNKNFMILKLLEIEYPLSGTPFGMIIAIGTGLLLCLFYICNFVQPLSTQLQFMTFLVWALLIVTLDYSQAILLLNISLDEQVATKLGLENVGLILVVFLTKPLYILSLGLFILQYFYLQSYLDLAITILSVQLVIAELICLYQEKATLVMREMGIESVIVGENRSSDRTRKFSTETLV
jgi:hypothetical protein